MNLTFLVASLVIFDLWSVAFSENTTHDLYMNHMVYGNRFIKYIQKVQYYIENRRLCSFI